MSKLVNFFEKAKKNWKINSFSQFIIIMIVFAIAGSLSIIISKPLLEYFGLKHENMSTIKYYILRILIIFPVYQIVLIIIGSIFGQFKFFYEIEKKMLARTGVLKLIKQVSKLTRGQ